MILVATYNDDDLATVNVTEHPETKAGYDYAWSVYDDLVAIARFGTTVEISLDDGTLISKFSNYDWSAA